VLAASIQDPVLAASIRDPVLAASIQDPVLATSIQDPVLSALILDVVSRDCVFNHEPKLSASIRDPGIIKMGENIEYTLNGTTSMSMNQTLGEKESISCTSDSSKNSRFTTSKPSRNS